MLQASNATTMLSIPSIAKIAAFGTLAAVLVMMAFVTIPAHATQVGLLNVKITNNRVDVKNFKIKVTDVLSHNLIVVKNVKVLSGNTVVTQIPVTISGNSVNVCVQALNIANFIVAQQCKAVSFSNTNVKTISYVFN